MAEPLLSADSIQPDHYWDDGRVPVFKPTMSQFSNFRKFVLSIREFGMLSGIVKVIPPEEWVHNLPPLDQKIQTFKLGAPIEQCIAGSNGAYRQMNLEKRRGYTIAGWRKICETSDHLPPAKRGERRKTLPKTEKKKEKYASDKSGRDSFGLTAAEREEFKDFDYRFEEGGMFTDERCKDMEKIYWKTLTYNSPLYGADLLGSLFDDTTKVWNVARLPNLLSKLPPIAGVNSAYLYFGMWKATFSWHVEDMDLYSINYIHFGAPKFWYSISQPDRHKFERVMRSMFPADYAKCSQFLRHKTFHASPSLLAQHGITVNKLVHHQHEFVITFPFGYHAGFNMGYNCAESVNFAMEDWLEFGRKAEKCRCIPDAVTIDINDLFAKVENSALREKSLVRAEKRNHKRKLEDVSSSRVLEPKKEKVQAKKLKKEYECLLCPNNIKEEPLLPTRSPPGKSAHRLCAAYIPETYIEIDATTGKDIVRGVETIGKARYALKCLHCRQSHGACFQCSHAKCVRAYHSTCAAYAGSLVRMFEVDGGTQQMYIDYRCRFHRPKRVNVDLLEDAEETKAYCSNLAVGDIVQITFSVGRIWAGRVVDVRTSEEMLLIQGENCSLVEAEWKRVLVPPPDLPAELAAPKNTQAAPDIATQTDSPKQQHAADVSNLQSVPNYSSTGYLDTLANCVLANQKLAFTAVSFSRFSETNSSGCLQTASTERWSSSDGAQYLPYQSPPSNILQASNLAGSSDVDKRKTHQQSLMSEFRVDQISERRSLMTATIQDRKLNQCSVKADSTSDTSQRILDMENKPSPGNTQTLPLSLPGMKPPNDHQQKCPQSMPDHHKSSSNHMPKSSTPRSSTSQFQHPSQPSVQPKLSPLLQNLGTEPNRTLQMEFSGLKYHIPNGRTMNVEYVNPQRKE